MFLDLHRFELPLFQQLQSWRTPALDQFFCLLNFFDTLPFLLLLIPIVWYGYSRTAGIKLCFILLISGWLNHFLKELFAEPRPGVFHPHIALYHFSSYGFPSGAGQQTMLLSGLFILTFRTAWAWALGLAYLFLISFSRIYLGVHFPSDVAGGWVAGLFLLWIYYFVFPKLEGLSQNFLWLFLILAFVISPSKTTLQIVLMAMGILMGLWAAGVEQPAGLPVRIVRIIVVILGLGVLYSMQDFFPYLKGIIAWSIGLWIGCGGYLIGRK